MQTSKVSVIVPCYNQAQYLDESLASIYHQTHTNWECLIVNDGSLDHTEEIAQKWEAKDPRFIYIPKENSGVSNARNLGIEKASGEFILTLDADDKYEASFMEKALKILLERPEIGIVSSWGMFFTNDKMLQVFRSNAKSIADFLFHNGVNMGSSLYRKECWAKAGKYDGDVRNGYEDWEFYLRVCALGWKVHIIEEVLFFYRQHQVSRRKEMNKIDNENKKYIYLRNKDIYFNHYEELIDRFLWVADLEKTEINKFRNTIDYKLGSAILKPLRAVKWFCIKLFKK
ncbi:glycosyltransferase family A protein [Flavobacterium alvei]|uniref:glycosyltransferase family 2 protein n=1 Tax=Flavobacterium alvei TaxID=2080416 RepID=UPI0026F0822F|nr:glycosyltransferase family A protein [Flavobacterium alvei]